MTDLLPPLQEPRATFSGSLALAFIISGSVFGVHRCSIVESLRGTVVSRPTRTRTRTVVAHRTGLSTVLRGAGRQALLQT
eukprot:scaffold622903_cov22-Prasinocladus_malaysianus.AAC.1